MVGLRECGCRPSPAVPTPVSEAEKHSAADVDAESVAELVMAARILRGVDRDILAEEQLRHGQRHQSPVRDAAAEPGGSLVGEARADNGRHNETEHHQDHDNWKQLRQPVACRGLR